MALAEPTFRRRAETVVDLPDDREYESEAEADLDRALVSAIDKADAVGDDFLAAMLRYQLGSFYYEHR